MEILNNMIFGDNQIRFKTVNGQVWGSLTDMAKASGKRVNNWLRLPGTAEYIKTLESIARISVIDHKVGGVGIPEQERGTWGIEEVILKFAGWCNPTFEIWCYSQIKKLLTEGKVELNKYELLENENFQLKLHMDDILFKRKMEIKADVECFTDTKDGDPVIAYKMLKVERDTLQGKLDKALINTTNVEKRMLKLKLILSNYLAKDIVTDILKYLKSANN